MLYLGVTFPNNQRIVDQQFYCPKQNIQATETYKAHGLLSNIVVEWLTLLLHIGEAPGSNLGLESSYPD
jgi:hypothetical protein